MRADVLRMRTEAAGDHQSSLALHLQALGSLWLEFRRVYAPWLEAVASAVPFLQS